MPESAQRAEGAAVARSIDAEIALEAALPSAPSGMPTMRRAGGGLSLGGAMGAGYHGSIPFRGHVGAGAELAGNGAPIWIELEKRGYDGETGGAVRAEKPVAAARSCDWDR